MEPFFDGGLFELLLFLGFAVCLNAIFLRKYLLLLFSVVILAAPVTLFFIKRHDLYYALVSLCVLNACVLVALLWKEKKVHPQQPLFNIDDLKETSSRIRSRLLHRIKNFF